MRKQIRGGQITMRSRTCCFTGHRDIPNQDIPEVMKKTENSEKSKKSESNDSKSSSSSHSITSENEDMGLQNMNEVVLEGME